MKNKNLENYVKETARDLIAFGSPIFFILVLARVSLLPHPEYLSQFIIGGILFLILALLLKTEKRTGLGLIILAFTTIYYYNIKFTIFAVVLFTLFVFALYYLKTKKLEIAKSMALGVISTAISYYSVRFLF